MPQESLKIGQNLRVVSTMCFLTQYLMHISVEN